MLEKTILNLRNELRQQQKQREMFYFVELLSQEISSSRCPEWIVWRKEASSLKLVRILRDRSTLIVENDLHIRFHGETASKEMVSLSIKSPIFNSSSSSELRFGVESTHFVSHALRLLKTFLPTTVILRRKDVKMEKENNPGMKTTTMTKMTSTKPILSSKLLFQLIVIVQSL